jgi:hypothetical protein
LTENKPPKPQKPQVLNYESPSSAEPKEFSWVALWLGFVGGFFGIFVAIVSAMNFVSPPNLLHSDGPTFPLSSRIALFGATVIAGGLIFVGSRMFPQFVSFFRSVAYGMGTGLLVMGAMMLFLG